MGTLLRDQRVAASRSRSQLARVSGTTAGVVQQVERGVRGTDLELVETLFAGLDLRLRLGVESVSADLDEELDRLALHSAPKRLREWTWALEQLDPLGGVIDGVVAALLHGVPLPADAVDLVLTHEQMAGLGTWLLQHNAMRWIERRSEFGNTNPDPAVPGPLYWRVGVCDIRANVCVELPAHVPVAWEGRTHRVRPLADVDLAEPVLAGLLSRWQDR
jgi:transcriptional regulator with XRE-family HTH domain